MKNSKNDDALHPKKTPTELALCGIEGTEFFHFEEISYVIKANEYTCVYSHSSDAEKPREFCVKMPMRHVEKALEQSDVIRVSAEAMVNLRRILRMRSQHWLLMRGAEQKLIHVTDAYWDEFSKRLAEVAVEPKA